MLTSRVPEEIHSFVVKYLLIEFCNFVLLVCDDFPRFPLLQVLRFLSWLVLQLGLLSNVDKSSRFLSDCMFRHSSIWALTAVMESALFSMGLEHTGQHISSCCNSELLSHLALSLTPCCSKSLSPCWQFLLSPGWGLGSRWFSFSVVRLSVPRWRPSSSPPTPDVWLLPPAPM